MVERQTARWASPLRQNRRLEAPNGKCAYIRTKNAKRRYFVPYTISEATDPLKIKEQEYASATNH